MQIVRRANPLDPFNTTILDHGSSYDEFPCREAGSDPGEGLGQNVLAFADSHVAHRQNGGFPTGGGRGDVFSRIQP